MICQIFRWLTDSPVPTTIGLALAGIGCLFTYDAIPRWRKKPQSPNAGQSDGIVEFEHRRAA